PDEPPTEADQIAQRKSSSPAFFTPELRAMPAWTSHVLAAQIEAFSPDIILNQVMGFIGAKSLRALTRRRCLIAGQIASPWADRDDDKEYDLIVSSLPNFISHFSKR